jgi:hypothetical protein
MKHRIAEEPGQTPQVFPTHHHEDQPNLREGTNHPQNVLNLIDHNRQRRSIPYRRLSFNSVTGIAS